MLTKKICEILLLAIFGAKLQEIDDPPINCMYGQLFVDP